MPTLSKDGRTLSFQDEGKGEAIVLLPPFPFDSRSFRKQIEILARTHRVIAPDYRGFGHSDYRNELLDMSVFAEDALSILDHLGINSVFLGGVSMGGYVAFEVLRHDPARVRALILWDTQCRRDDEAGVLRREQTAQLIETEGPQTLVESLLPRLLTPQADAQLVSELKSEILSTNAAAAASAMRGMARRDDARELLSRFSGPGLILVGSHDQVTPPEKARQMANLLSQSRYIEFAEAGHFPHLECPEPFNKELTSFLNDI